MLWELVLELEDNGTRWVKWPVFVDTVEVAKLNIGC